MASFKDNNVIDVEISLKISLFYSHTQSGCIRLGTAQGQGKQVDTGPEKTRKEQSGISSPQSDLFPAPLERKHRPGLLCNPAPLWACGGS